MFWLLVALAFVTFMPSAKPSVDAHDADTALWTGRGAPPGDIGQVGDLWLDQGSSTGLLYGPKILADTWPSPCVVAVPEPKGAVVCRLANASELSHTVP